MVEDCLTKKVLWKHYEKRGYTIFEYRFKYGLFRWGANKLISGFENGSCFVNLI